MADNNKASVKLGNTVYSLDDGSFEYWSNVTSTYPYLGGELQTEFWYGDSDGTIDPNFSEAGAIFVYHNRIYGMAMLYEDVRICPLMANFVDPQAGQYGMPVYFDTYNASALFQDEQQMEHLTEFPAVGARVYTVIDGDNVAFDIPAETYTSITGGSTATDAAPVVHEWQRYRNGSLLPFKPATVATADDGKLLAYDATSDSIKPTNKNVAEYDPSSVTEGDPLVFDDTGKIVSTNELTLANITVTDTATIAKSIVQETEQVTSTEDTIVLRENAVTPVPARGSGVIINNYDGNGTPLGILADSDGTVRVGAEGGAGVTYPVLWQVGSDYYNAGEEVMDITAAVTPQGVYTSADASYESTDSIVYYNGSYYFKYIDWYVNPKVFFSSNSVLISNGPPAVIVTDEDLIAILDTLTPVKVKYYVNAVFTTVGDKQPLLTRDEEADLSNGAPLVWNAAQHKAKTSSTPDGNKVLKSVKDSVTGVVTYEWSSSGSGAVWRGTQAQLTTALAITDPNNEAYIPNNAMIIVTDASDSFLIGEDAN